MSAAEGQAVAKLLVCTLQGMRTEESFTLFFKLVEQYRQQYDVKNPELPRKRKAPRRYEVGIGEGTHSTSVEDYYRPQYYEALDVVIASINRRFDQPGYNMYKNLESLLVEAANGCAFEEHLETVTTFYKEDLNRSLLSAQLQNFSTQFAVQTKERAGEVLLAECLEYFRGLSSSQKEFYSEVGQLVCLILVMPATNAVSERTFSTMRRLKTYL